jgi:hypothetical protein
MNRNFIFDLHTTIDYLYYDEPTFYFAIFSLQDLRAQPARNMADFLWCSVKENVGEAASISFDRDGLELAKKYFCSTTLTMRLAGITQINSHINMFNEMCNTESVVEVENVGLKLAGWILQNKGGRRKAKFRAFYSTQICQLA